MENKLSVNFQLLEIGTPEFAIIDTVSADIKKLNFNTVLQFGASDATTSIMCNVTIELLSEQQKILLKLKTDNLFKIKPKDWESFKTENILTVPKGFLAHIAMISVGTARGILHCRTENTNFNNFVLPLVNVASIILEDEQFEL